jgi:DNA polymerase family A
MAADDNGLGLVEELRRAGVGRSDVVGVAVAAGVGVGLAVRGHGAPGVGKSAAAAGAAGADGTGAGGRGVSVIVLGAGAGGADPSAVVRAVEEQVRPRWVWWSGETARALVEAGVRVSACWDVAAVQRLLVGGLRADPARVWAQLHDLAVDTIPQTGPLDLFSQADDDRGDGGDGGTEDEPVRRDGHLRPEWVDGGWSTTPDRLGRWAALALEAAELQRHRLGSGAAGPSHGAAGAELGPGAEEHGVEPGGPGSAGAGPGQSRVVGPPRAVATARAESAAELLCAELSVEGLPMDRAAAEALIAGFVGPRPRSEAEAAELRARRDAEVLAHVPSGGRFDLRSPGQVRSLLRRVGVEVPDTRAWRLEAVRDAHPVIDALLRWRKAERIATTYGYAWLDEHVGEDGRLRGSWSSADGAAGRMTASAGLHNMPADLRAAVVAEPGHVFVRADLGQIEPRVLAAVSGDRALARATVADDMYAPVADQLGVDRETAKVAMLGAMYGQTSGHGTPMLRRLTAAYPVAMGYLLDADRAGQAGRDLRTYGGRAIRMGGLAAAAGPDAGEREARRRAAARGRYGRNAMIQGAAAELFKVWAATVRARAAPLGARIVLCLHDELLVHAPADDGAAAARLVGECLQEAVHRWAPDDSVRFVADIAVIPRWSDAKP